MLENTLSLNKLATSLMLLENYIPSKICAVKDLALRYIYISERFVKLYGLTSKDFLFKSSYELKSLLNMDDSVEDHDIIQCAKPKSYLKIIKTQDKKMKVFIINKTPILDPLKNTPQGVLLECTNVNVFAIGRNICKSGISYISKKFLKTFENIRLSHREQQVVFLFLANFNSLEIAEIINKIEGKTISKNTIDSIFRNLFVKFDCINRIELYEILIYNHFEELLPSDILPEGSMLLPDGFK